MLIGSVCDCNRLPPGIPSNVIDYTNPSGWSWSVASFDRYSSVIDHGGWQNGGYESFGVSNPAQDGNIILRSSVDIDTAFSSYPAEIWVQYTWESATTLASKHQSYARITDGQIPIVSESGTLANSLIKSGSVPTGKGASKIDILAGDRIFAPPNDVVGNVAIVFIGFSF